MKKNKIQNPIIIVCGGRGKRMGKITNNIPKPMIKIGKQPNGTSIVSFQNKRLVSRQKENT